ncbi:hypothetical protein [Ruficoccus sp. ZRK36]|uniref:hypothetical protein n=1 Tax=Ruficoccus sp. ZRK36 TaxID=2866311 RepID=UPI001C72B53A|nr:hypothetical protein [Ruficoccus sp. ZRK36]QYY36702.1 hypothetical protein K0V07_04320 [Ruficoccus sp. ZRK36]
MNKIIHAFTLAILPIVSVNAATVFNYGPSTEYVTNDAGYSRNVNSSGSGTSGDPYVYEKPFSDTSELSPASSYTGPQFFGGYVLTSTDIATGYNRQQVRTTTGNPTLDRMVLQFDNIDYTGTTLSFAGVYIFKQDQFNPGYTSGAVSIDGFYSIDSQCFSGLNCDARWVVEIDDVYYVNNSVFSLNGTRELTGENLQNALWAVYDPATSLNFDQSSAVFSSLALDNVAAVGLYFEKDSFTVTGTQAPTLMIGNIQVTGTIPESSSSAILMGLFVMIAVFYRMKRR